MVLKLINHSKFLFTERLQKVYGAIVYKEDKKILGGWNYDFFPE